MKAAGSRILVTGAQGFIGRYTVASLLEKIPDAQIIGCGRSPFNSDTFTHAITVSNQSCVAPLPPEVKGIIADRGSRYRYASVDISDKAAVRMFLEECRPDIIIHLASALRDEHIERLVQTNILGTSSLIEAAKATGCVEKIVFGSSGSIYGMPSDLPIDETYRGEPRDLYAATKLAAEHTSRIALVNTNIRSVFARIFNVVGPGQEERHIVGKVAAQLTAIINDNSQNILELGDLRPTRDFIDVRDVASGLTLLAHREQESGAFNLASGKETSMDDIVDQLLRISGIKSKVHMKSESFRPLEIPRHFADIRKIGALGFSPRLSIDESLRNVFHYYQWVLQSLSHA